MSGTGQITPVDEIAQDDQKLEERAEQLVRALSICFDTIMSNTIQVGVKVKLEPTEAVTKDPQVLDKEVLALLIKKNGGEGAVRIIDGTYIPTGHGQVAGTIIVTREPDQTCVLFGSPSVRYFRRGADTV